MSFIDRWLARARGEVPQPEGDPERIALVQSILEELAPAVALDGGRIELVRVTDDGWVEVELQGACRHCSLQDSTLRDALEPRLRESADWLAGVRAT